MGATLLIMAAGLGRRYGGAKQLDGVGPQGEALFEYALYDALLAGFDTFIIVTRPALEATFRQRLAAVLPATAASYILHQSIDIGLPAAVGSCGRCKPWGTGHAVLVARAVIKGPFAVINADDFYGRAAFVLLRQFLDQLERIAKAGRTSYALIGYRLERTLSPHGGVSRGVCQCDVAGRLQRIVEYHRLARNDQGQIFGQDVTGQPSALAADALVSLNAWAFPATFLSTLAEQFAAFAVAHAADAEREFYLPNAVDTVLQAAEATVQVLPCEEHWLGITHQADRAAVVAALEAKTRAGLYPTPLGSIGETCQ